MSGERAAFALQWGVTPSMGLFYHADARSAGERARGFQVARISDRSNALDYGRAGMQGGSLYDAKGLRPLGPWLRADL